MENLAKQVVNEMEEIRIDQVPTQPTWKLTPLYKESGSGAMLIWHVEFDGKQLISHYGHVDGKIQENKREVIPVGGKTVQEQALQEARRDYRLKFEKEFYRPAGAPPSDVKEPALANKWTPGITKRWPLAVQPKLDGIRMLAKLVVGGVRGRSRGTKTFPFLNHIKTELAPFFAYLPNGIEFDGELYNPDISFNIITSIVRKTKAQDPREGLIRYYIFDITLEATPYEERYNILVNAYNRYLEDGNVNHYFTILPTEYVLSDDDVLRKYTEYVSAGYEGIILRKIAGPGATDKERKESFYKPGRSSNILKYKEFIDEEVTVLGVVNPEGKEKGKALLEVKDIRGNVFTVRPRGSFEMREEWLKHPELVIDKPYTIRYQELSEYGVPRFPVGIAIRNYE